MSSLAVKDCFNGANILIYIYLSCQILTTVFFHFFGTRRKLRHDHTDLREVSLLPHTEQTIQKKARQGGPIALDD